MLKRRTNKSKNIITEEIMSDSRLSPLFNTTTKLLLQFFVLEIKNKSDKQKEYRIAYAWCLNTTREDVSDVILCSNFNKIYTSPNAIYSIAKISIYNYPSIIIDLVNELLSGQSLINSSGKLNTSKLKFDVSFTEHFAIRPIIFNDKTLSYSHNRYEKNALMSPYKDVSCFTLIVSNLDKMGIVRTDSQTDDKALLSVLKYLQDETTLPFLKSECARLGNIEFIYTPCADAFEVAYVNSETVKEEVNIDYKKVHSCKKITISITPNIHTCSKNLLVNCIFENGGQVVLDECKKVYHQPEQVLEITFESIEQIGSIAISIWKEENDIFQIWYKYAVTLIKQFGVDLGIVGLHGKVKSPWLDAIEKSNSKTKEKVAENEKISKTSYEKTMTIGAYGLDPWVEIDRSFTKYIKQIHPEKSDAEFFPQGWSVETEQHGSISFLEWFRNQTKNAQKVVIQDPFYDTVGLEFLVRTTNAGTNFIVLTCTQTTSTDDDTAGTTKTAEPNRAIRIKSFISSNPTLFDSIQLNIYDMRSSGGGDTNLLHDRYILIFEDNILQKGFHLSNSIQGATKKQPLLITPIPQDILLKVDSHINDSINKTNDTNNTVDIINLYDHKNRKIKKTAIGKEIINQTLFDKLKKEISTENPSQDIVSTLISDALSKKTFPNFWATFGYFLAKTHDNEKVLSAVKAIKNPVFAIELRKYLELSITEEYPLGFSETESYREYDFQFLFVGDFKTIIKYILRISNNLSENFCFGNWGVYYGCNLLLDINFTEYIVLIEFIRSQYDKNKNKDLKNKPISKLSTILFTQLLEYLLWRDDTNDIKEKLLCSNISYLKAIATAIFVSDILKEKSNLSLDEFHKRLTTNLSTDYLLDVLLITLLECKFINRQTDTSLESNILSAISDVLIQNFSKERLQNALEKISNSHYPSIEAKFTEEVLFKLEEAKLIDAQTIFQLWSERFLALFDNYDSHRNHFGLIDVTGWSFQIIDKETKTDFVDKLKKRLKRELIEIRKPFRQETRVWDTSFEKILLLKMVLMIGVLHATDKKEYHDEILIIDEISHLTKNYRYFREHSQVCRDLKNLESEYNGNLDIFNANEII